MQEYAFRRSPVFERTGTDANADVRILRSTTDVTLTDPDSWVSTSTVSKVVLTYAGKKANSEIKLNYNPVWQQVELISATVSNLDGKRSISIADSTLA